MSKPGPHYGHISAKMRKEKRKIMLADVLEQFSKRWGRRFRRCDILSRPN